jgi:hypothetical protein
MSSFDEATCDYHSEGSEQDIVACLRQQAWSGNYTHFPWKTNPHFQNGLAFQLKAKQIPDFGPPNLLICGGCFQKLRSGKKVQNVHFYQVASLACQRAPTRVEEKGREEKVSNYQWCRGRYLSADDCGIGSHRRHCLARQERCAMVLPSR